MAFASLSDRAELRKTHGCNFTVQIIARNGSEVELAADDVEHALNIQSDWLCRGARVCEIFRVLHDGSLNQTIGAEGDKTVKPDSWGV